MEKTYTAKMRKVEASAANGANNESIFVTVGAII